MNQQEIQNTDLPTETTPPEAISPQVSNLQKQNNTLKVLVYILGLTLFLIFIAGAYYLGTKNYASSLSQIIGTKQNSSKEQVTNQNVKPKPIETEKNIEDPKSITFLRDGDIWSSDIDGSNQRQLTKIGNIFNYYLIPNSNRILLTQIIDTTIYAKILELNSNEQFTIRHNKVAGDIVPILTLSPNGAKAIIGGALTNEDNSVILYDLESQKEHVIQNIESSGFSFSPDSQYIAYVSQGNIFVLSLKDESQQQLTNFISPKDYTGDYRYYEYPKYVNAWTPDGKNIIYAFGDSGQGAFGYEATLHLYEINIDSKKVSKLTQAGQGEIETFLDLDTKGENIYYRLYKEENFDAQGNKAGLEASKLSGYEQALQGYSIKSTEVINKLNVKTGSITNIPLNQASSESLSVSSFKTLPSGKQAIYGWGFAFSGDLWIINTDGTNNNLIINKAIDTQWKTDI